MKFRRFSQYFSPIFLLTDLLFLNIGFLIANHIRFGQYWFHENKYPFLYIFLHIAWIAIFFLTKINNIEREKNIIDYISQVLLALIINIAVVFTMWASTKSYFYSREHLFHTYLIFSIFIITWRIVFIYFIRYYRSKGFNTRNVIIVGNDFIGKNLETYCNNKPSLGYIFKGYFDYQTNSTNVVGNIDAIPDYCMKNKIDIIFCCLSKLYNKDIKSIINFSENNLIKVKILSRFDAITNKKLTIQRYGSIPVINISAIPLDRMMNRRVKRTFDLIFSSLVIVFLLSWVIPIIALFIKLESKGSILFKQKRIGRNEKPFYCLKFRSMKVNSNSDILQATKNDERITKFGNFLRRFSLDELPQFINVFLGNMSVVGPRPHMPNLNHEFSPKIDRFIQRHAVKPGVTGLAQVKGYRGETAKFSDMYGRIKLDKFYVKNWNFLFDIKIIFVTIFSVIWKNEKAY